MIEFRYIARNRQQEILRGRIFGESPAQVRVLFGRRGQTLVSLQKIDASIFNVGNWISSAQKQLRRMTNAGSSMTPLRSLSGRDIELLLDQLAVMLESGLGLTVSLRELGSHHARTQVKNLCDTIATSVEQGEPLAAAMAQTKAFPVIVSQLVQIGESTGELPSTLKQASQFVRQRRQVVGDLVAALAYPCLVATAAMGVAVYLIGWAIPRLATFLHAMGRSLPPMTQRLLDLSTFFQTYGTSSAIILVAAGISLALAYAYPPGRYQIDQRLLQVPIVGRLLKMIETQQLSGALALMLKNGVFLPDALKAAATLHQNRYLAKQVEDSRHQLARGRDLSGALAGNNFSPMLISMIAVGERTGNLTTSLQHVSNFYAKQVEIQLKRIGRMIEPAIIVIVGGVVGYVYVAFFMALLSAGGNFQ